MRSGLQASPTLLPSPLLDTGPAKTTRRTGRGRRQQDATGKLADLNLVVVVPAFNESAHIEATLRLMPHYIRTILVVDDASTDETAGIVRRIADHDSRIELIRHPQNLGVGGAMVTGYRRALELNADIVVKMDADGQMSPDDLPSLVEPLIRGDADYTKGNRFRDLHSLARMPLLRRAGNMALSFLTKAAVGYWQCFDPCNGYVAIRGDVLRELPLDSVRRSFFFETSMLAELYLLRAVVCDVPMAARYGGERSHLSIRRVLAEFPARLAHCLTRRILLSKFVYDFSVGSVYLLTGVPMMFAGILYGLANWIYYWRAGEGAPTGTVVIPAMLIILGFQFLLSAVNEDLQNSPREPLCGGWGLPASLSPDESPLFDEPGSNGNMEVS